MLGTIISPIVQTGMSSLVWYWLEATEVLTWQSQEAIQESHSGLYAPNQCVILPLNA